MRIVLASASPRRRELLAQIGLEFEVSAGNVQEKILAEQPWWLVEELALQKAEAVSENLQRAGEARDGTRSPDGSLEAVLVVGADTVVAVDGHILGKPASPEDAGEMLRMLSGRSHEVYTGVALIYKGLSGQIVRKTFYEKTEVVFYPMSEAEIADYVSTGDCMDKAGAYGIQGLCARYIRKISGDYNNVVGLPVGRLYQEAREWLGE